MNKLKFGFLGIGNCGNQVVNELYTVGYKNVVAINSSSQDMDSISEDIYKLLIGEFGCGKRRSAGKNIIKKFADKIMEENEIKRVINESHVIFIINSSGGGTGSGEAPILIALLKRAYPDKCFVNMPVSPDDGSDWRAIANSLEYFQEIKTVGIAVMPYSNRKGKGKSSIERQNNINKSIVEDVQIFNGILNNQSDRDTIDERDFLNILSTPGVMTISKINGITENILDNEGFDDLMVKGVRNNSFMETETDKVISTFGLILNIKQSLCSKINKPYTDFISIYGEACDQFEHVSLNDTSKYNVVIFMAGLSYPETELVKFYDKVTSLQKMEQKTSILDKCKAISSLVPFDNDKSAETEGTVNNIDKDELVDILNAF